MAAARPVDRLIGWRRRAGPAKGPSGEGPAAVEFFGDFHTHTRHSHGRGTVGQNARAAAAKGLELLAITDHGPASLFGVGAQGLQSFREIRREARQASGPGLTVLTGVEANVISFRGHLDIPAEWAGEFDLIIAGLHLSARPRCPRSAAAIWGRHFAGLIHRRFEPSARSANTHALIEAVCAQTVHIVSHPGHRFPVEIKPLAQACAWRGTALEINVRHGRLTAREAEAAAEEGCLFVVSSDAHEPQRVGELAAGAQEAAEAGLSPRQVLNARLPAPPEMEPMGPDRRQRI